MATTDTDLLKMMDKLRKENNQLKMENSQLFKELDILNRKVRTKFGRPETTLHTLMEANDVAYTVNSELSYSIPLSAFMSKFYKMYPESQARLEVYERRGRQCSFAVPLERGHLGGPHRAIIRSGGRYEQMIRGWLGQPAPPPPAFMDSTQPELSVLPTTVTKQFARDLPSLIRINGKGVQGSSDNEKVVAAYNMLLEATNYNEMLTQKLMEVANQNLGILLYEDLVNHYSESGFLVKQTWYHYLDITFPLPSKHRLNQPSESEVMIYMLAIFELQSSDFENNPPLFVKSMLELAFALNDRTLTGTSPPAPPGFLPMAADDKSERMVNAVFSTPTFNILPFLHSVDLDDEEPVASPPSTSPSYVPLPSEPSE